MTADAPIRQFGADAARAGRSRRAGRSSVPAPICGRRVDDRRRIDLGRVGHEAEQQLGLGDDLIADVRDRLRPRQRRAPLPSVISSRSRSPGTTCRRNFASLTPRR